MEIERLKEYIKREQPESCTLRRWASAWFAVGKKKERNRTT